MSRLLAALPDSWQQRYRRWLDRRIPPRQSVLLTQANLFIFLSRQGLYFLLLVLLIWVGATNFQNNLAYGLCFLLLSVLFVAILQTFANVSGLTLRFVDADPVVAGDVAWMRLEVVSPAMHQQLSLAWPGQVPEMVTVQAGDAQRIFLPLQTVRRGVLRPGRLHLQSVYPLGVVRCWTWLDLGAQVLVYPKPVEADFRLCCSGDGDDEAGQVIQAAGDEYFALKPYVQGDPRSHIAWKQFAAGRGLFVREYAELRGGEVVLDFSVLTDADIELRLSKLCYCALQLHAQSRPFGLRLPGTDIAPSAGEPHLRAVLSALALFAS